MSLNTYACYGADRFKLLLNREADRTSANIKWAVDILRVGAWFEHLRWRLDACTAYALGKVIQPDLYLKGSSAQSGYHHNTWIHYAKGARLPGLQARRAADFLVPNASRILDSVVWDILDVECPFREDNDRWIFGLSPAVQAALYESPRKCARRRRAVRTSLRLLECQGIGLDGVAGAVFLLREAHHVQDLKRCLQIGISLHSILLMACSGCPIRAIVLELIAYFVLHIFPLADDGDVCLDVDVVEFRELAFHFGSVILMLEDFGRVNAINAGATREWRMIFKGDFGRWLSFAFCPALKLSHHSVSHNSRAKLRVDRNQRARPLALEALRGGDIDKIAAKLAFFDSIWND